MKRICIRHLNGLIFSLSLAFHSQVSGQSSFDSIQVPIQPTFQKEFSRQKSEDFFLAPDLVDYSIKDKKKLKVASEQISLPGLSTSIPSAFGANWGLVFAGFSLVDRVQFSQQTDAVMALGAGFGNSKKYVGLSAVAGIYDLKDEFGKDGGLSFKLHRQFGDGSWSIAAGVMDAYIWGQNVNIAAHYLVAGKFIPLKKSVDEWFYGMLLNVGAGTARFSNSLNNIDLIKKDNSQQFKHWGAIASLGIGIVRPLSTSVAWTGNNLDWGFSIAPLRNYNLVASFTAKELLGDENAHGLRYTYTLSYSHSFHSK